MVVLLSVVKELEMVVCMVGLCVMVLLKQLLREGDVGVEMREMRLERRRRHGARERRGLRSERLRRLRRSGGDGEERGGIYHELRELRHATSIPLLHLLVQFQNFRRRFPVNRSEIAKLMTTLFFPILILPSGVLTVCSLDRSTRG